MIRFWIVSLLLFLPELSRADVGDITYSWWLTAKYDAVGEEVNGEPAKSIDSDFEKVTILSNALVEESDPSAKSDLKENKVVFTSDFKRNGKSYRASVGVYAGKKGKGRFLLIQEEKGKAWKKTFVAKVLDKDQQFSCLSDSGSGALLWCSCMECDACGSVEWSKKKGFYLEYADY